MYSQPPSPPSLKRTVSGESQNSHASQATTASRASSKLLFGEIPLTPATTVDGRCEISACAAPVDLLLTQTSNALQQLHL